jgi:hypothetical protein
MFRYKRRGARGERRLGLGSYQTLSLAAARVAPEVDRQADALLIVKPEQHDRGLDDRLDQSEMPHLLVAIKCALQLRRFGSGAAAGSPS